MSKEQKKGRRRERERAFRAIFQMGFHQDSDELVQGIDQVLEGDAGFEEEDESNGYARLLATTVLDHTGDIDQMLSQYLRKDWHLDRIPSAEKAILRLSTAEMIYLKMPKEIAINEAVELAKQYGNAEAPNYINGILNHLAKDNQPMPVPEGSEKNDSGN